MLRLDIKSNNLFRAILSGQITVIIDHIIIDFYWKQVLFGDFRNKAKISFIKIKKATFAVRLKEMGSTGIDSR